MRSGNDLTVISGDARVSCHRLQEFLGYKAVRHIHDMIRKHRDELEDFGEVFARESKNPSPKGGRPTTTYYLNEHQATAVCLWAETPKARSARRLIIEVFTDWRKGQARPTELPDAFGHNASRVAHVADHLGSLDQINNLALKVTHLPIWNNGRRPTWWHDIEVRAFLTQSHRQMSLLEAERVGSDRFGNRCPRKSSIHSYWQRLDDALGPARIAKIPARGGRAA